jgi:hydrogenase-1 operon protein HyaE
VIVPEIQRAFPGRFAVGVLLPAAAREFHPRYGFRRWPAFVLLRDGQYLGAVDGLRNWDEYVGVVARLLEAPPTRAPTVGIAVKGADAGSGARDR